MDGKRECLRCGNTYNLIPEYEYDDWNLGHFGCTSPTPIVKRYKDPGCPYCREREEKERDAVIKAAEQKLHKCKSCGKAHVEEFEEGWYIVECNCLKTAKKAKLGDIMKLVDFWNKVRG